MNARILIVDDDGLVIRTLSRLLKANGYRVSEARNGKEAIESVDREEFDLVISDIRMPGIDGIQTVEHMKSKRVDEQKDIPVILVTGYASEEAPINAVKLGVVDYILKPFNTDEILAAVKRALRVGESGNLDMTALFKRAQTLVGQFQKQNERNVFEDENLRSFVNDLNDVLFLMEKKLLVETEA